MAIIQNLYKRNLSKVTDKNGKSYIKDYYLEEYPYTNKKLIAPFTEFMTYKVDEDYNYTWQPYGNVIPYDIKIDLLDNEGTLFYSGKRHLITSFSREDGQRYRDIYATITVDAKTMKSMDEMLQNNNYTIIPSGLYLYYGNITPQVIESNSREWLKGLSEIEIKLENVIFDEKEFETNNWIFKKIGSPLVKIKEEKETTKQSLDHAFKELQGLTTYKIKENIDNRNIIIKRNSNVLSILNNTYPRVKIDLSDSKQLLAATYILCNKMSISEKLKPCYTIPNISDDELTDVYYFISHFDEIQCDYSQTGYHIISSLETAFLQRRFNSLEERERKNTKKLVVSKKDALSQEEKEELSIRSLNFDNTIVRVE